MRYIPSDACVVSPPVGGGQVTCADIPEPFVGPSPSAVWRSVISAIDGPASPKLATLSGVTYFGLSHPTVRLARRAQRGLFTPAWAAPRCDAPPRPFCGRSSAFRLGVLLLGRRLLLAVPLRLCLALFPAPPTPPRVAMHAI